jgi:hypothetical protein
MAVAIALGATSMSDIAVLAQLAPVLGAAPSGRLRRSVGPLEAEIREWAEQHDVTLMGEDLMASPRGRPMQNGTLRSGSALRSRM